MIARASCGLSASMGGAGGPSPAPSTQAASNLSPGPLALTTVMGIDISWSSSEDISSSWSWYMVLREGRRREGTQGVSSNLTVVGKSGRPKPQETPTAPNRERRKSFPLPVGVGEGGVSTTVAVTRAPPPPPPGKRRDADRPPPRRARPTGEGGREGVVGGGGGRGGGVGLTRTHLLSRIV